MKNTEKRFYFNNYKLYEQEKTLDKCPLKGWTFQIIVAAASRITTYKPSPNNVYVYNVAMGRT